MVVLPGTLVVCSASSNESIHAAATAFEWNRVYGIGLSALEYAGLVALSRAYRTATTVSRGDAEAQRTATTFSWREVLAPEPTPFLPCSAAPRLPPSQDYLDKLARTLKTHCGSGGTFRIGSSGGVIEIQGDKRELIRKILAKMEIPVKG